MSMLFDDIAAGGQIFCGTGSPIALGLGPARIRGSAFVEGPHIIGRATEFPFVAGCVMIAPLNNKDSPEPFIPGAICRPASNPFSLIVSGNAGILGNLDVDARIQASNDIVSAREVKSQCGAHVLSRKKNFDIPHPSREGWRLRHTCPEGPSNDVYFRGRITNKTIIFLPLYWEKLVDPTTITVNLTPIGAHQNVIVKRIGENKVFLQPQGGMPIDCYYLIIGERKDVPRLKAEQRVTTED